MSHRPLLSHDSAIPTASVPDEQAFTTLSCGPRALILRAIYSARLPFKNLSTEVIGAAPFSRYDL